MFGFERLEVWHVSIEFADVVYQISERFPRDELFGLRNQVRRAAVSVSSNIAEGSGRGSNREYIRFLQIAYGSLMESVSQSALAKRRGLISDADYDRIYGLAERVARMLSRLRTKLEENL